MTPSTPDSSYPATTTVIPRWEWLVLGAIVLVGAILRLYDPGLAYFNLHVGRDLYRALQLLSLDEVPLLGSEMQYGGRVFGPLIYVLYAIPLAFRRSWMAWLGVAIVPSLEMSLIG